jgi:hypothetical protein
MAMPIQAMTRPALFTPTSAPANRTRNDEALRAAEQSAPEQQDRDRDRRRVSESKRHSIQEPGRYCPQQTENNGALWAPPVNMDDVFPILN